MVSFKPKADTLVNAVCFADESSTNILVSGSDDGYVKIWDRRSLSGGTPSGVLVGATEGITYTAPKGDGRYIVVNSKDQAARLYDLRKMKSWSEFEGEHDAVGKYGRRDFDCKFLFSLENEWWTKIANMYLRSARTVSTT
jgi:WD repeat-containing protein 23